LLKIKGLISICLVLIILFSTLFVIGCGSEPQSTYLEAQTIACTEVWKDINSGTACSATVAVMENDKIVYSEGFGMADRENSIPVTNQTIFNMGSISKVYCATAIMLLGDAGKVSLDNPVTQYLSDFRMADPRYKDITVRMLLNHTSGLPGTSMANSFGFEENKDVFKDLLETLSTAHLKHAPGEMAIYCNDGFTLAEMVVERVSQKKYIDFLSENIFAPLSLRNTGVSVGLQSGKVAAAYYQPGTTKKEPLEALSVLGAGGLSATAEDLCRFADTFSEKGKQILSKSSLEEMKKAQPSSFTGKLKEPSMSFGLGWDMTELPAYQSKGIQVLGKSGGTGDYSSMMYTVPEQRLSVAVIASGPSSGAGKIALDILDKVLVEKGLATSQTKAVTKPLTPEKLPQEFAAFAGYYAGNGQLYRLAVDDKENTVTVFSYEKGAESPVISMFYNNGYLHAQSGGLYYLITVDGRDYLVSHSDLFNVDSINMEKLSTIKSPLSLEIDVNGKQWLRRNAHSFEGTMFVPSHLIQSYTLEDLPGYVEFLGVKSVQSPVFAGMPAFSGRDQTELTLFERDGEIWVRVSDMVYSPAVSAGTFESGESTVQIGENGYNEWLKAGIGLVLSYEKPAKGRIIAFSPDGTCTYDSAVDTGDLYVPQGGFVEFDGAAGDVFKVTVSGTSTGGDYKLPEAEDFNSLTWTQAFDKLHAKLLREYAFTEWKGIDWYALYAQYQPRIASAEAAKDPKAYYLALREYVHSIPDGHVGIEGDDLGLEKAMVGGGFGLVITLLDDGRVVASWVKDGGPAAKAGLRPGAEILEWDSKPVMKALAETSILFGPVVATDARRQYEQLRFLVRAPVGTDRPVSFKNASADAKETATLRAVDDDMETLKLTDQRSKIALTGWPEKIVDQRLLPGNIGYLSVFAEMDLPDQIPGDHTPTLELFRKAIDGFIDTKVTGIIIDVRGNAGGYDQMTADFLASFYASRVLYEYTTWYNAITGKLEPGWLDEKTNQLLPEKGIYIEPAPRRYDGPVVALVNNGCVSSGEGVALGINNLPNGKVVGFYGTNGSFGMSGDKAAMPGGYVVHWPFGQSLDKNKVVQLDSRYGVGGVLPNKRVPMTLENALSAAGGHDVELDYALQVLSQMQKGE